MGIKFTGGGGDQLVAGLFNLYRMKEANERFEAEEKRRQEELDLRKQALELQERRQALGLFSELEPQDREKLLELGDGLFSPGTQEWIQKNKEKLVNMPTRGKTQAGASGMNALNMYSKMVSQRNKIATQMNSLFKKDEQGRLLKYDKESDDWVDTSQADLDLYRRLNQSLLSLDRQVANMNKLLGLGGMRPQVPAQKKEKRSFPGEASKKNAKGQSPKKGDVLSQLPDPQSLRPEEIRDTLIHIRDKYGDDVAQAWWERYRGGKSE